MSVFISFEGGDGSGKTTQVGLLREYLDKSNYDVLHVREPGGTSLGDALRKLLLENSQAIRIDKRAMVLGFCMARAQLISEKIIPHLQKPNGVVLCDRYIDSTIAYQVYAEELIESRREVISILDFATSKLMPDLTFLLDLDVKTALNRANQRHGAIRRGRRKRVVAEGREVQLAWIDVNDLDAKEVDFHERVREGYLWSVKNRRPSRWKVIDASLTISAIASQVRTKVASVLEKRGIVPSRHVY